MSSAILLARAWVTTQEGITLDVSSSVILVFADVTCFLTTSGLAITFPPAESFSDNIDTPSTGRVLITPTISDPDTMSDTRLT